MKGETICNLSRGGFLLKSRRYQFVVVALCAMMLCGCTNEIPEMSQEQSEQISEYVAARLLSYDKDYKSRLLDEEEIAIAEKEEAEKAARAEAVQKLIDEQKKKDEEKKSDKDKEKESQDGEQVEEKAPVELGAFLQLDNITIQYTGYQALYSYPAAAEGSDSFDMFFAMNASAGKKLVVLQFDVTNLAGVDQNVDMLSKQARYSITTDQTGRQNAQVTMLTDDLSTLGATIPAGGSIPAVIIMETDENVADSLTGISLGVKYNGQNETVQLQ